MGIDLIRLFFWKVIMKALQFSEGRGLMTLKEGLFGGKSQGGSSSGGGLLGGYGL